MNSDKVFQEIKSIMDRRKKSHEEIALRLENIAAFFQPLIKRIGGDDATMSVYIFPADQLPRPPMQMRFFQRPDDGTGVIFAAEFVIEHPKFMQNCCVYTIQDIRIVNGEESMAAQRNLILHSLKNNPIIHDTLLYLTTDGFGHLWRDPINEAHKKIIKANERRLDEEDGDGSEPWRRSL